MKTTTVLKIVKILTIIMLVSIIFSNFAFATTGFDVKGNFTGTIENSEAKKTAQSVQDVLIVALTVTRIVGMAIAIIMLIVVGIKIMMASPSERANIKQYTMNYVIGAVVLLGASGIVAIVQKAAMSAFAS